MKEIIKHIIFWIQFWVMKSYIQGQNHEMPIEKVMENVEM